MGPAQATPVTVSGLILGDPPFSVEHFEVGFRNIEYIDVAVNELLVELKESRTHVVSSVETYQENVSR